MQELQVSSQMEINGGSVAGIFFAVVIGTALYKIYKSNSGRISIPRLISFEWRR